MAFLLVASTWFLAAGEARADEAPAAGDRPILQNLLLLQDPAALIAESAVQTEMDDEPPRVAPIPRRDLKAEREAEEKRQKEELAALPAYKRWWFWALTAAVVGGTVVLATTVIDPSRQPAKACTGPTIACFGDGR